MSTSIVVLSLELTCFIFCHLEAADACSFRLSCHHLEYQTRRKFTTRFLTSPRIRLTAGHLNGFMRLCAARDICSAVKDLHISLYMPELSCRIALGRIEQDMALSGKENDYLRQYITTLESEQSSDISPLLCRIFSTLPNLRTVSLSANIEDVAEFAECERLILNELSTLTYQRYHHQGYWRFMKIQRGKAIATTLQALGMVGRPVLERLIVDKRLHTTQHLSKNYSFNSLSRLHTLDVRSICQHVRTHASFQNLRTLDLSISEYCIPEHDLPRMWFVLLIQSAPGLRILTLMFHHPLSMSLIGFFLRLDAIDRLERLTLSSVSEIEDSRILTTVNNLLRSLNRNTFTVCSDLKTIQLTRTAPSLQTQNCDGLKLHYGQLWITELAVQVRRPQLHLRDIDWRKVSLRVVDKREGLKDLRVYLPRSAYSSWLELSHFLAQMTNFGAKELQGRLDIVHVSTDGVPVLRRMDQMYIKSRAFEESIAAASCWSESSQCLITMEICRDGLTWADQSVF
jgi:hypothetical protein